MEVRDRRQEVHCVLFGDVAVYPRDMSRNIAEHLEHAPHHRSDAVVVVEIAGVAQVVYKQIWAGRSSFEGGLHERDGIRRASFSRMPRTYSRRLPPSTAPRAGIGTFGTARACARA